MSCLVLGLDFGGTKIAAGIVDLIGPRLLASVQTPTRVEAGASAVVTDMIRLARQLDGIERIEGIGVAFGGHVRDGRILRSLHVEGWPDFPLREALCREFGDTKYQIANDANAVALGEWKYGAGRGVRSMLFTTVSTGIGGGVILDGALREGVNGMAGEIGHMKVVQEGPLCTCGKQGCLEAVAAGPAIVQQAQRLLAQYADTPSVMRHRATLTAEIVARAAHTGDPLAAQVIVTAARSLGTALGNAINLLDVECVVIGGGVSRSGPLWWDSLMEALQAAALPWSGAVSVRRAELGKSEGIWGAVALLDR